MSHTALFFRLLLCVALLLTHYLLVFFPVNEAFLIYILLLNPRWFRDFLNRTAPEA